MTLRVLALSTLLALVACRDGEPETSKVHAAALTVPDTTRDAFSLPLPTLSDAHLRAFFVGNSFFNLNWVAAPASVHDRDGLGPLFNARSCSTCHFRDGRGAPQTSDEPPRGVLLRISVPGAHGQPPAPHVVYGDQLQTDALPGLQAEVKMATVYTEQPGLYADGEPYSLRVPRYRLDDPAYGALPTGLMISARVAPATIGLGLLEAVPEPTLRALAAQQVRERRGISGRVQELGGGVVGRFGWKAEKPTVRAQSAGAFQGDMGITSSLFGSENHSAAQALQAQPSGGTPELTDQVLDNVVSYMRTLAVPEARAMANEPQGRALFEHARCASCHVPSLESGVVHDLPELSRQTFAPFTDLLLHDLGEGLSDHRPSFAAQGNEWRTAPLWGIGLISKVNGHSFLLHDGRARGVAEAILWHGGEAQQARDTFVHMTRSERALLVAYVESR